MHHLLFGCPFSRQIWHDTFAWLHAPCAAPDGNTVSLTSWRATAKTGTPKAMRKGLCSTALLVPWMIWKQRNSCVFEGAQASIQSCSTQIREEARLWATAGALGLRAILPQTWDVH